MSDYPWSARAAESGLPVVKIEVFSKEIESGRPVNPVLIRLFGSGPQDTVVSWDVHPSTQGFTAVDVSELGKTGTPSMSLAEWHDVIPDTYKRMGFPEPPESHLELKHKDDCRGADSTELIQYWKSTGSALAEFFNTSGHPGAFDASGNGKGCTARFTPTETPADSITIKASVGLLKQPKLSALCIKFETCPPPGTLPELQYSGIFYLGGGGNDLPWFSEHSPCEGFTAVDKMDSDSGCQPSVYAWKHMVDGLARTVKVGDSPNVSVQVHTAKSNLAPADTLGNWFTDTRGSSNAAPILTLEWPGAGMESTYRVIASSGWLRADLVPSRWRPDEE